MCAPSPGWKNGGETCVLLELLSFPGLAFLFHDWKKGGRTCVLSGFQGNSFHSVPDKNLFRIQ